MTIDLTRPDPIYLEIFKNFYQFVAEQMGIVLQNTASSVNIKERWDFSCAIFDRDGLLIANAPHIPVHLGSMGESVINLISTHGDRIQWGDVYLANNPYRGGTHLPDVTAITPIFDRDGKEIIFYVASRGHQADIGGIAPGSMPPHSQNIIEEGILFDNFLVVVGGVFQTEKLRDRLMDSPYPARNIDGNIADLRAQIAANERGGRELLKMVAKYGLATVSTYMKFVRSNAAESVKEAIDILVDGEFSQPMDNGAVIKVAIVIDRQQRRAKIDFTGTSAQLNNNFNAPRSITQAAVLYVFRTLVTDRIPLNAGCLEPLDLIIPAGSMLDPLYPAAVVAGNVETSQAIVNCLYGALGIMAAAQGTMNNFTFGNDLYQYYETICGGSGAGDGFDGTAAVQTHMTNSRLTDPEILETRYPVMVESFAIRPHSGGKGRYTGGDGTIRKIKFLAPMSASILANQRIIAPFGLDGGEAGKVGGNSVRRANGSIEVLDSTATIEMQAGDTFIIETPGGGGYGNSIDGQ
jgi:N-methylhydantoinase B